MERIVEAVLAPGGVAATAAPGAVAHVVEIGPGRGALTGPLLSRGLSVVALELDGGLAAALRLRLPPERLTIVEGDAVTFDLDALVALAGGPPVPLVGNLPYESATPMVRRFVRRPDLFPRVVVMVQKEVAERIAAGPGTPGYGFLSVDVAAHAAAARLFDVAPGEFSPPPKVVSSVVALVPRPPRPGTAGALAVASAGFASRRKTLLNALGARWGRERAAGALRAAGLPATTRAEEIGLDAFERLAAALPPPGDGGRDVDLPARSGSG